MFGRVLSVAVLLVGCSLADVSPDSPPVKIKRCGEGLVPIPTNDPEYCMMRYEASVDEQTQLVKGVKGGVPSNNISLIAARAACERTPVLDKEGQQHGFMRLATLRHWSDSGDGLLGEGGRLYPWGDQPQKGLCILDKGGASGRFKRQQPSGSDSSCKSIFGIYDQLGNLWEWVDLELTAEAVIWAENLRKDGWELEIKGEEIFMSRGDLLSLYIRSICIHVDSLFVKKDGSLHALLSQESSIDCKDAGKGYLIHNNPENPVQGTILPVYLELEKGNTQARVLVSVDRLGERVGAKVGGSYYSGGDSTLKSIWVGHIPTFDGSIGFRCEAAPYEEEWLEKRE